MNLVSVFFCKLNYYKFNFVLIRINFKVMRISLIFFILFILKWYYNGENSNMIVCVCN